MNNPEIKKFIRKHSKLFWYTPEDKKEEISEDFLLETILNYGSLDDSLQLINLIGNDKALSILQGASKRRRGNYYPEIYHFFTLYLSSNAQRGIK